MAIMRHSFAENVFSVSNFKDSIEETELFLKQNIVSFKLCISSKFCKIWDGYLCSTAEIVCILSVWCKVLLHVS